MKQKIQIYAVFIVLTVFFVRGYCYAYQNLNGCFSPFPILSKYKCAGLVEMVNDTHARIKLSATVHFCDCGAPDCFGTNIEINMHISRANGKCFIESAKVMLEDYNKCEPNIKNVVRNYDADLRTKNGKKIDLYNPGLEKLVFINKKENEAVVIGRDGFIYYDEIHPNIELEVSNDCDIGVRPHNGFFEIIDKYKYALQIIAVSNEVKAKEYFEIFSKDGFKPFIRKENEIYKIIVGRGTKIDAKELKKQIEEKYGFKNTWVIKSDSYFDHHLMDLNVNVKEDWDDIKPIGVMR